MTTVKLSILGINIDSDAPSHEDLIRIPVEVYNFSKTSLSGNSLWPRPSLQQTMAALEMIPPEHSQDLDRQDVSDDEIEDPKPNEQPLTKTSEILDLNDEDVASRLENFLKANYIRNFVDVGKFMQNVNKISQFGCQTFYFKFNSTNKQIFPHF